MSSFNDSTRIRIRRGRRAGIAQVELVMALPILMLVMGAMIAYGAAAAWKLQLDVAARDVAWSHRRPRTVPGLQTPHADLPLGAKVEVRLDDHLLGARGSDTSLLDRPVFDFSQGVVVSRAGIRRTPPVLTSLGEFELQVEHPILIDPFQYRQTGLSSNRQRRLPMLLPQAEPRP